MHFFLEKNHGILSKQFLKSGGIFEECILVFLGISNPASVCTCMYAHMQKGILWFPEETENIVTVHTLIHCK